MPPVIVTRATVSDVGGSDMSDLDPFLTEARARAEDARVALAAGWIALALTVLLVTLWSRGVYPVVTFILAILMGLRAIRAFEEAWFARTAAGIALNFRSGIED